MFLKRSSRRKNGKEHYYWSLVENKRVSGGRVVQRHVLYLGEINSSQEAAWRKTIEVLEAGQPRARTIALFPEERAPQAGDENIVGVRLHELELHRPRQWGACWLAGELYGKLGLDGFWRQRLCPSRKGTPWDLVLQTLVTYRLIDPGSEWRLHRHWYEHSAMGDLLGEDFRLAADDTLYRCLDLLLEHKTAIFSHLTDKWKDLFNAKFEVLLYDLTSTYFESAPPFPEGDKRRFGYSRDKRFDCVQVVIALIVTPEGFPLAYEVLSGNTSDKTTLKDFLKKDRGAIRQGPTHLGDGSGRSHRGSACGNARVRSAGPLPGRHPQGAVKPIRTKASGSALEQEVYVLARSHDRVNKERAMRRRQLKSLWKRLRELQGMKLKRDALMEKVGAAKQQYPAAARLVEITVAGQKTRLVFTLRKDKLRQVRRREGRYLLRTNLTGYEPARLWEFYLQLAQVEEAFRNFKGDLSLRPVYHQREDRIEAHIFVAFLAYCLHVTLRAMLRPHAPGLTPRAALEKFKAVTMIDVHLPTSDGRTIILPRHTQPEVDLQLLLHAMKLKLPAQPPPRIRSPQVAGAAKEKETKSKM